MQRERYSLAFCILLALLFASCRPNLTAAPEEIPADPVMLLKPPTMVPFWFELGPQGPLLIPSPAEASLEPFLPWNHARHITSFLPEEQGALFAGINRGGILHIDSEETGTIAIYYYQGGPVWEAYPLAAFFRYKQKPAALLSGDRFFSAEDSLPPETALWTLASGRKLPNALSFGVKLQALMLPALEPFSGEEGWETPVFFQGNDTYWYFRELRRGAESFYFRTVDVSLQGEKISAASFLEAAEPAGAEKAPPLLALVLEEAERLLGRPCTTAVVSPEFSCRRLYRSLQGNPELAAESAELELPGYYRDGSGRYDSLALVLLPDGRAVYGRSSGGSVRDGHFRLPALPVRDGEEGNFSYTAVALAGDLLAAAWEEQSAWNVGAAGFVLLEIDW